MRGVDIGRFRRQGGFGLSNAGDRKVQNSTAKHDTPPFLNSMTAGFCPSHAIAQAVKPHLPDFPVVAIFR
jgi:hypothetical protein